MRTARGLPLLFVVCQCSLAAGCAPGMPLLLTSLPVVGSVRPRQLFSSMACVRPRTGSSPGAVSTPLGRIAPSNPSMLPRSHAQPPPPGRLRPLCSPFRRALTMRAKASMAGVEAGTQNTAPSSSPSDSSVCSACRAAQAGRRSSGRRSEGGEHSAGPTKCGSGSAHCRFCLPDSAAGRHGGGGPHDHGGHPVPAHHAPQGGRVGGQQADHVKVGHHVGDL